MVDLTWSESFEVLAVIARKEKEKELGLIHYYGVKVADHRGADGMPIVTVWAAPSVHIENIIVKVKTPGEIKIDLDHDYMRAEREFHDLREEHSDLRKLASSPDDVKNVRRIWLRFIDAEKRLHGAQKAIQDWHIGMGNV